MYKSVLEALIENSKINEERLCIADNLKALSYKEFTSLVLKYASLLLAKGVNKSDRVLIESSYSHSYIALMFAIECLGAVFVPVAMNLSSEKINSFIKKASPSFIILNRAKEDLSSSNILLLKELQTEVQNFEEYILNEYPDSDAVSEILFTTGTTGDEKGIILSYNNNVALSENVINACNMQKDNVEMILAPLNHSHGLRRLYANIYNGSSVVLHANVSFVGDLLNKVNAYKVNAFDFVPSALSIFLNYTKEYLKDYKDVFRYIQFGGAAVNNSDIELLKELLPDTKLLNMYGSTESGISIYCDYKTNSKKNCIGKPTFNSDIFIVEEETQVLTQDKNKSGYIATKSRANMLGYLNEDPSSYKDVMSGDFVYSNDIAYFDEDGDIILLGRKGDVINCGGYKINPSDIESVAILYSKIQDCACIGIDDPILVKAPKLFIVKTSNDENFDKDDFTQFMQSKVESYMVPKNIEFIEKIPRTAKGSIQRSLLK